MRGLPGGNQAVEAIDQERREQQNRPGVERTRHQTGYVWQHRIVEQAPTRRIDHLDAEHDELKQSHKKINRGHREKKT